MEVENCQYNLLSEVKIEKEEVKSEIIDIGFPEKYHGKLVFLIKVILEFESIILICSFS